MKTGLLIYGAYGYTGELIARHAVEKGLKPILAGRDPGKIKPLADSLDLAYRAFSLDDAVATREALEDIHTVLHCAGPFKFTYAPMSAACLATGTHYLDITGEIEVFEGLAAKNTEAEKAGVMLLPGAGFDVVPSDCLANHLQQRLPDASELTLAFYSSGRSSRGTSKTVIEGMGKGGAVRRNGKIVAVPAGWRSMEIDFGDGKLRWAATIPWGDVSTAFHSTHIPNIQVYMAMHGKQARKLKYLNWFNWLLGMGFVKNYLKAQVDKQKPGPDEVARNKSFMLLWGQVKNEKGTTLESRMKTPEGYSLTALTAVEIAKRVLKGDFKPGFQTPAKLYGADFIRQFPGVTLTDI